MSNIDKLNEGAKVLQNVDVGSIFTSLAEGIANAQEKLDKNSVARLREMADTPINGKNLIELGFQPTFYAFQYADIQCALNVKVAQTEKVDLGVQANLQYGKDKGFSKEHENYLKEQDSSLKREEFKSAKDFSFRADTKNYVRIEKQAITLNKSEGSVKMLEDYAKDVSKTKSVNKVKYKAITKADFKVLTEVGHSVTHTNGYLSMYKHNLDEGLVRIDIYGTNGINIKGDEVKLFEIKTNFQNSLSNALKEVNVQDSNKKLLNAWGISKGSKTIQTLVDNTLKNIDLSVYFETNISGVAIDFAYEKSKDNTNYSNKADLENQLEMLAMIARNDQTFRINLTGYADSQGKQENNVDLGNARELTVQNHLLRLGVKQAQITTTKGKGETEALANGADEVDNPRFRRVDIALETNSDWIWFSTKIEYSLFSKDPETNNITLFANKKPSDSEVNVKFVYNEETYSGKTVSEILGDTKFKEKYIHTEKDKRSNLSYAMHKETEMSFKVYSNTSENIEILEEKSESGAMNGKQEIYISENKSSREFLNKDTESLNDPSKIAIGAAVDFRYSKQFDMSMQGNASMSARLVALPAPEGLVEMFKLEYKTN